MAYANNKFCWHGCVSTDVEKAKAFYPEVLGWTAMDVEMGTETATMLVNNGVPRAHLMAPPMEGVPSHWSNYLRVDDVDARTAACVANGGTLVAPAMDIPPGRFSVVNSPSGATVCLFHERDEAGANNAPRDEGGVTWTELWSKDLAADLAWLKSALGITSSEMEMPTGTYHLLESDGVQINAGAMQSTMDEAPAMWLTWIHVANVDETLERANNNGGGTIMPGMDVPNVGRLAVIRDSTGAVLGVMTPHA